MNLTYPRISKDKSNNYFVTFYFKNIRYRLYSSKKIGGITHPNKYKGEEQLEMTHVLAAEVYNHFKNGGKLIEKEGQSIQCHKDYLKTALKNKQNSNYSKHYTQLLDRIYSGITQNLNNQNMTAKRVNLYLSRYCNPSSFNTIKKHLNALLEEAYAVGLSPRIEYDKKSRKTKAKLHKPFDDLPSILNEIKGFNLNLYLCCLLTYGCLLRPHREIRLLTWGDFLGDLSFISLSGDQNKSGRNRIVPVPSYIKGQLNIGLKEENIFSKTIIPFNEDYFKSLWSKFKKESKLIKLNQTLYSFRHTGAIRLFEKTKDITKLQKAMGHSSMRVSLSYLRGLEIAELKEEDMPIVILL
jgi:integrase